MFLVIRLSLKICNISNLSEDDARLIKDMKKYTFLSLISKEFYGIINLIINYLSYYFADNTIFIHIKMFIK